MRPPPFSFFLLDCKSHDAPRHGETVNKQSRLVAVYGRAYAQIAPPAPYGRTITTKQIIDIYKELGAKDVESV